MFLPTCRQSARNRLSPTDKPRDIVKIKQRCAVCARTGHNTEPRRGFRWWVGNRYFSMYTTERGLEGIVSRGAVKYTQSASTNSKRGRICCRVFFKYSNIVRIFPFISCSTVVVLLSFSLAGCLLIGSWRILTQHPQMYGVRNSNVLLPFNPRKSRIHTKNTGHQPLVAVAPV